MKRILSLVGLVTLTACIGCQTLTKNGAPVTKNSSSPVTADFKPAKKSKSLNPISKLTGQQSPIGNPDSIVAIWKDATLTVAGQRPTRGFGGRLYFHDRNDEPVRVDGDLIVYGFKNEKQKLDQKPEKRFVFTKEELAAHLSYSAAGPSYSVWLPWDHVNGEQKEVIILAVFKDARKGGRICSSDQIPAFLPGTKPIFANAKKEILDEVRRMEAERTNVKSVDFEQTKPAGTKKIKSHEIMVPQDSKERLFGRVPTTSYVLPTPKVMQASAIEPIPTSEVSQPSTDSLPDPRQARSGQFVRQGTLPPGSQPPRLGAKSSLGARR